MLKTLGRKLVNNIGLKLLALFLATVLWMVVVNTEDPMVRKSMTVSVSLKNQEYITDMGKYMDVLNESNTVTFYYTTKRSVWDGISGTDFAATADMEKIEAKANGGYRVPVMVSAIRNANQITIETKQLYLDVALEDLGKQQFQIKANTAGTVAEGCALGTVTIDSTNVVQVSGPASVINRIDSVIATINVDQMANDIKDNVVPVFYDVNGEVVDTTRLEKSVDTVRISAQILNTKEVPLSLSIMGTPAEGYLETGVFETTPQTVRIAGTTSALNRINKIVVSKSEVDITGATGNLEQVIDLKNYLPNTVYFADSSFDGKVYVTVYVEPIAEKKISLAKEKITIVNVPEGYTASFPENINMPTATLYGLQEKLNAMGTLGGTVDIATWMENQAIEEIVPGLHVVPVEVNVPEGFEMTDEVSVYIEFGLVQAVSAEGQTENTHQ